MGNSLRMQVDQAGNGRRARYSTIVRGLSIIVGCSNILETLKSCPNGRGTCTRPLRLGRRHEPLPWLEWIRLHDRRCERMRAKHWRNWSGCQHYPDPYGTLAQRSDKWYFFHSGALRKVWIGEQCELIYRAVPARDLQTQRHCTGLHAHCLFVLLHGAPFSSHLKSFSTCICRSSFGLEASPFWLSSSSRKLACCELMRLQLRWAKGRLAFSMFFLMSSLSSSQDLRDG